MDAELEWQVCEELVPYTVERWCSERPSSPQRMYCIRKHYTKWMYRVYKVQQSPLGLLLYITASLSFKMKREINGKETGYTPYITVRLEKCNEKTHTHTHTHTLVFVDLPL